MSNSHLIYKIPPSLKTDGTRNNLGITNFVLDRTSTVNVCVYNFKRLIYFIDTSCKQRLLFLSGCERPNFLTLTHLKYTSPFSTNLRLSFPRSLFHESPLVFSSLQVSLLWDSSVLPVPWFTSSPYSAPYSFRWSPRVTFCPALLLTGYAPLTSHRLRLV